MSGKRVKRVATTEELKSNKLISHPTRFTICFLLYFHRRIGFAELQRLLGLTPGNLDSHLRKLREAGYVEMRKVFTLRGPRTAVQITPIGSQGFREHAVKFRKMLEKIE
ncbi:MAG: transcriptional regulator [Candidatus Hodarchaeaceae archaeon]|nr:transcriptional regulator [Candidatus Hodarchaeaceae archaeon]